MITTRSTGPGNARSDGYVLYPSTSGVVGWIGYSGPA